MSATWLKLVGIGKSFGGIPALKPVTLELQPGEILGLVGENGAGKSTLIKILSGIYQPDVGTLRWLDRDVIFTSPSQALQAGIATIHQELAFFGHLTVAENLLFGRKWPRYKWGGIDWNRVWEQARLELERFHIEVDCRARFAELSSAQKQEVAIARALARNAKLMILDEPTASISDAETEALFLRLSQLKQSGTSIIYISHRLDEILRLTDRVAVLRDGELVAEYPIREASVQRLAADMVGRPLDQVYPCNRSRHPGSPVLELHNVSRHGMFERISLSVHSGEIVGLAGLIGSGRSELARAIYGLYPIDEGRMLLHEKPWKPATSGEALHHRVIYIPEERKRQGFVVQHSLFDSVSIGGSDLLSRIGWVPRTAENNFVRMTLQKYGVRARSPKQAINTLSGGNQQKSLLGRWLERDPSLVILDEPTRGVDVGAKSEIYRIIDQLAEQGKAVLLISSDLPEVLGMSDRVFVLHQGKISVELTGPAMTQENVIMAASGANA